MLADLLWAVRPKASVDDPANPRDDRPHGEIGRRLGRAVGALEALPEHLFEGRGGALAVLDRDRPEAERVHHHERRRRGFLGEDLGEAGHRRRQSLAQAGLRPVGDSDPRGDLVDDRLEGREEAGLLGVEVLIEGRLRDAGEPDELAHRGLAVAVPGDSRDHRPFEPPALVAPGVGPALSAAPAVQRAEDRPGSFRGTHVLSLTEVCRKSTDKVRSAMRFSASRTASARSEPGPAPARAARRPARGPARAGSPTRFRCRRRAPASATEARPR